MVRRLPLAAGFALLSVALVLSVLLVILVGEVPLSSGTVLQVLLHHLGFAGSPGTVADAVVWQVRLPRALSTVAVGGVLATCGVVFQGLLLNPLAEPYTLGVASGAAFGAALSITFGLGLVTPLAFAGSLAALALVWVLGRRAECVEPTRIILAGVVVSSILGAGITLLKALAGEQVAAIVLWLMGSFTGATWKVAIWSMAAASFSLGLGLLHFRELDILAVGGRAAILGVNEDRLRLGLLAGCSLATATVVSFCGVIGFVGLVVPHLLRLLFGPSHGRLLPLAWLGGGLLLLYADLSARMLGELPVGVITALVGGPVFCLLLWRRD